MPRFLLNISRVTILHSLLLVLLLALGACGGGSGSGGSGATVAPSITAQPQGQTVIAPATATFTVTAAGTAPLSYQWSMNGSSISGATSASYTTPPTTTANNGESFTVTVTDSAGSILSSAALLTVNQATGTLGITIMGLPSGAAASVTVSGPNGFSMQLTSSQNLQVAPGNYTVTANQTTAGNSTYFAAMTTQTVSVTSSATSAVTVNYSTIIPNTTLVLDAAGMASLTVSPDGTMITLSTSSAVANSLAVGDVLASAPTSAAPNGLLVSILSVRTSGQTVTALVQQATLEDAIQQGSLQFSEVLGPSNTQSRPVRKSTAKGPFRRFLRQTKPNASSASACAGNPNTIQEPFNVPITGGLSLSGEDDFCPTLNFSIQISGFQIVAVNAQASAGVHTSIGLLGTASTSFSQTQNLATLTGAPITVPIGDVPITVQPTLTPFVGVSGSAAASVYTGIATDTTATVGVSYTNGGWNPIDSNVSPTTASVDTSIDGQVSLKAFAGLRVGVLLEGIAAPYVSIDGYLQFTSGLNASPCWTLTAGEEGSAGVNAAILGVSYSTSTLNLFSNPVLQATTTCFAPVLNGVTPNSALLMSPATTIALSGSNFVPDSTASINGQQLTTTFEDPSDMTAIIPASDLTTTGTYPITVNSPDNPGGTSSPLPFTVGGTVTVSPASTNLVVSTSQQFTATVEGPTNTAVTWSVNNSVGGNSTFGTITTGGLYTAPATVPSPATVTVTATSQANNMLSGSASVAICGTASTCYIFSTVAYPGGSNTIVDGINNSGEIVGSYVDQVGSHGFLYSGGNYSTIDYPGAAAAGLTGLRGINDSGQIVGDVDENSNVGFLYSGGTFTVIAYPGGNNTIVDSINNSGQIVGSYVDESGAGHGFLYSGGSYSTIDYPGAAAAGLTGLRGINDSGQIVGDVDENSNVSFLANPISCSGCNASFPK